MSAPRLDVQIVGEGRGLVLLHSLLSDRTSYEPLAARLAGQRRLILPNLPGFGRSPPAGPAVSDHADAIDMPERRRQRQARGTDHRPDTVRRVLRAVTAGASAPSALLLGEQGPGIADPGGRAPSSA